MKMKSFVVFGLGKFGQAVADKLMEGGADVMVVDSDEAIIEQYSTKATSAICADLTEASSIQALGVSNMDCAIIAMSMNLEASIMCVMISKESGVSHVAAKASSARMGEILKKVGADEIIFPEEESGYRTAKSLLSNNFLDFFDISEEISIVEIKPLKSWVGHSLRELNLRKKFGVNVIAIRDGEFKEYIDPELPLKADVPLLVMVHNKNLHKISEG